MLFIVNLTQKQETFAQNLFKGLTQREAWIQAGYSSKYAPAIIDVHACQLAAQDKIKVRLTELNLKTEDVTVATVKERKEKLTQIMKGDKYNPIQAIAELNKMGGDYAPDKHIIEGEILITPDMRALAVREMLEIKEAERLLKEGKDE